MRYCFIGSTQYVGEGEKMRKPPERRLPHARLLSAVGPGIAEPNIWYDKNLLESRKMNSLSYSVRR